MPLENPSLEVARPL